MLQFGKKALKKESPRDPPQQMSNRTVKWYTITLRVCHNLEEDERQHQGSEFKFNPPTILKKTLKNETIHFDKGSN